MSHRNWQRHFFGIDHCSLTGYSPDTPRRTGSLKNAPGQPLSKGRRSLLVKQFADVLHPGRVRTLHLKAFGAGPEAVIGEDKVDWKGGFAFCESKGKTRWYVVERETSKDPLDAVKRNFEALRKMGKV